MRNYILHELRIIESIYIDEPKITKPDVQYIMQIMTQTYQ